jgi:voltage-gated potassium channel
MKIDELKPAYYSIAFLIGIFLIGINGFYFIEGWSFIDSLYMTVQTLATVGYGEVHPLSHSGKIFVSLLITVSFGFYAFSITLLARYIVSGVFRNYFKYSKVIKEIDKLENHVIVVGYGRNGSQAIKELTNHKIPVVVIDNRGDKIKEIQQTPNLLYLQDDPSSDEVLLKVGIKRAKALISVLPTDEENLFVVLTTRELNPNITIISRAINHNTIKKLKIAGASNVIMPDKISGQQMAQMIAQPNAIEFLDYLLLEKSREFALSELSCSSLDIPVSISLGTFSSRTKNNLNFIGLKRGDGRYLVNPDDETVLTHDDCIFVLGRPEEITAFRDVYCKKG